MYNVTLKSKFNFGKYKGKTLEEVLNKDENYIFWYSSLDNVKLDKEANDLVLSYKKEEIKRIVECTNSKEYNTKRKAGYGEDDENFLETYNVWESEFE